MTCKPAAKKRAITTGAEAEEERPADAIALLEAIVTQAKRDATSNPNARKWLKELRQGIQR